jgi:hypothetical protein
MAILCCLEKVSWAILSEGYCSGLFGGYGAQGVGSPQGIDDGASAVVLR